MKKQIESFRNYYQEITSNKYARLMRLHKPVGIWLALFPALWAVALLAPNFSSLVQYSILMALGSIFARTAGCIINDIVDKDIDRHIVRTNDRPLAANEVTIYEAILLVVLSSLLALSILLMLPRPVLIIVAITIPLIILYPFLKRFTFYPQLLLGLVFNIGAFVGSYAAINRLSHVAVFLYVACVLWNIGYDTIYGHQDKVDDQIIGVKSLSIKLGAKTNSFVWSLYQIMMIIMAIVGLQAYMNLFYFIGIGFATYCLYWQTATLNIDDPQDCNEKFLSNVYIGFIIWCAILIGRL